jgi:sugar/nucleoside kinase (ribokinase family)
MSSEYAKPSILCAGILVADIFVPPLPQIPPAGSLSATDDFLLETGGCAANVAVGLARLGISAGVTGLVGKDAFGDFLIQSLTRKGIGTEGIHRAERGGTSKTVILTVTGEDRRFIHTFGTNALFRVEEIDLASLPDGGILYLGGYLVMPEVQPEPLADLFHAARLRGIRTVLDVVVPAGEGSVGMEALRPVLPHTDYFLPNDEEAHALTGESDPLRQAARFLQEGCGVAVITQGKRGTLLQTPRETLEIGVYPIEFVDGSGSGDAFTAGFLLGLQENWSLPDTLRFASAIGASACTRLGCTTGVFNRTEAEAFIAAHPIEVRATSNGSG